MPFSWLLYDVLTLPQKKYLLNYQTYTPKTQLFVAIK